VLSLSIVLTVFSMYFIGVSGLRVLPLSINGMEWNTQLFVNKSIRALILYRRRRFINHLLTYLLTYIFTAYSN